jgi:hypothetical protein
MLVTLLFAALLTVAGGVISVVPFDTAGGGPLAVSAHHANPGLVVTAPNDTAGGGPLH